MASNRSSSNNEDINGAQDAARYGQYADVLTQAWQASSGFERQKLAAQIDDANAARQNALAIAKLQAGTSLDIAKMNNETQRYGIDTGRQNLLDQLKENQRQFDANHDLDMAKFGLSKQQFAETQREYDLGYGLQKAQLGLNYADAYTKYSQTPDMVWALNDFKNATNRVAAGLGPQPLGADGTVPQPKTWDDFAALNSIGQSFAPTGSGSSDLGVNVPTPQAAPPPAAPTTLQQAALSSSSSSSSAPSAADQTVMSNPAMPAATASTAQSPTAAALGIPSDTSATATPSTSTSTPTDPRLTAATAVMKALPPSGDIGHDQQDWAALNAIQSLYFSGQPGAVERLGQQRQKIAQAGLARLGFDPIAVNEDRQRGLAYQGSVRQA